MIKIRTKNNFSPIKQTVLFVVAGFLLLLTVVFVVLAIMFSFGGAAPSMFGSSVYICEAGAFDVIAPNSAVIAAQVSPEKIHKDHIILYKSLDEKVCLAKVNDITTSDGVLTFSAINDSNEPVTISQGQMLGKVNSYSTFLGGLFTFLTSPVGVLLLAIIPCIIVFAIEIIRLYQIKHPNKDEVTIVRKQDEVPTFTPYVKNAVNAYKSTSENSQFDHNSDDTIIKNKVVPPLFLGPKANVAKKGTLPVVRQPLSQRRLDEAIAETLREKEIMHIKAEKDATPAVKRTASQEMPKKADPENRSANLFETAFKAPTTATKGQTVLPKKEASPIDRNKPTLGLFESREESAVPNSVSNVKSPLRETAVQKPGANMPSSSSYKKAPHMPDDTFVPKVAVNQNVAKAADQDIPFSPFAGTTQSIDVAPPKAVRPSFWEDETTAKSYVPRRRPTKSKPSRLDELLNDEDDEDVRFDIDDILKSLENK